MKKTYHRPMLKLYHIVQQTALLAGSLQETGVTIMSGNAGKDEEVLSRGSSSLWDDEE